jgi:hypothetical protein
MHFLPEFRAVRASFVVASKNDFPFVAAGLPALYTNVLMMQTEIQN